GPLALPPVGVVSVDPGVDDVNWIDNVVEVRARQSQLSSSGHRLLPHLRSQIFDGDTSLRNATVQSPLSVDVAVDALHAGAQHRPGLDDDVLEACIHLLAVRSDQTPPTANPAHVVRPRRELRQEPSASRETSRVRDPAFTGVQSQKCVDGFRSLGLGDDDDRIELVRPRQHHELDPGNAQRLLHDREILISHDASIVAAFGCQYRLRLALSERPLPPVLTVAQLGNGDLLSRRCLFSTPAPDPFPEPHHYSVPPLATAFFEMPKLILHSSTTFIE